MATYYNLDAKMQALTNISVGDLVRYNGKSYRVSYNAQDVCHSCAFYKMFNPLCTNSMVFHQQCRHLQFNEIIPAQKILGVEQVRVVRF